nr:unnamed protein product [Callosobruchus chinensis]
MRGGLWQIASLLMSVNAAFSNIVSDIDGKDGNRRAADQPVFTNNIQRFDRQTETSTNRGGEVKALKKVFLSNRSITCNDGSQAGFYLRKSHSSKMWIIFLEGGWYCYDHHSCRNRWLKQRHYMTSSHWPDTRDVGGMLSPLASENPFWYNANHVFVAYCTSDSWSGSRPPTAGQPFGFMGSLVVGQVIRDLLPLGLENGTEVLLAGSSAGGVGVMLNLDFVKELLHDELQLRYITVRGITDSGWFLDRTPYAPTNKPTVDAIKKGMEMWRGKVPRRCREEYLQEPWRCYFGYRIYPTLKSDLFVFQWLFDEAQISADNVGAPVTKQQWDYIHEMGDALKHSFQNVSAVFAPSCVSHAVLTKRDWQQVKIDDVSIAEALHCWEQKTKRRRLKRLKNAAKRRRNRVSGGKNKRAETVSRSGNKRRQRNNRKGRRKHDRNRQQLTHNRPTSIIPSPGEKRPPRTLPGAQKPRHRCAHRRLERCSWPQCNHSCPRLHDPFTGEEMDFIQLLKSFGLDMDSVANALGIDIQTLNNMDHGELLNLLTQQST